MTEPISRLLDQMAHYGANRFYAKRLAPNDNSKNQVYLGGGFGALNILPHGPILQDDSSRAGSVRDRAKALVNFFWIDEQGLSQAPDAQLILYPKYPEVRMSGFLRGSERAPAALMRSRDEGRILFFGVTPDGRVIGHVASQDMPVAAALEKVSDQLELSGVFIELQALRRGGMDPKAALLSELLRIHQLGWIPSQKMDSDGKRRPYSARNGGGYTLEAQLGISPNGYAEPDFLGWEVKQYGVRDFEKYAPKSPVTLMTPEPTGGVYRDDGIEAFLRSYGYADKSGKANRINFGGVYAVDRDFHGETGLRLALDGFDSVNGKLTDVNGAILLIDRLDRVAASWGFKGIIEHWNRKHAKAVYVPSLMRSPPPKYAYGGLVHLCEGTDVLLLLTALARGAVYYDPGIKMEDADTSRPAIKRRSQFRIKHKSLHDLYQKDETITLEYAGTYRSQQASQVQMEFKTSDDGVQSAPADRQKSFRFSNES